MLDIKLRHEKQGDYVYTTVFARHTDNLTDTTYQRLGKLVMSVGEYQIFWAALHIGQEKMQGHLIMQHEGWSPDKDGS